VVSPHPVRQGPDALHPDTLLLRPVSGAVRTAGHDSARRIHKKTTYFKSLAQLLHKLLKKSASLVFVLDLQAKIP